MWWWHRQRQQSFCVYLFIFCCVCVSVHYCHHHRHCCCCFCLLGFFLSSCALQLSVPFISSKLNRCVMPKLKKYLHVFQMLLILCIHWVRLVGCFCVLSFNSCLWSEIGRIRTFTFGFYVKLHSFLSDPHWLYNKVVCACCFFSLSTS